MKKLMTITIFGVITVLFFSASAIARDYREMKQEVESYETTEFYRQSIAASHIEPTQEKAEAVESELLNMERKFEELKKRWDAIIKQAGENKGFFDFETEKSQQIRGIAGTDEIKEMLKQKIDTDTLISVAFERNPGLKSSKKVWESTLEKYSQATRLDNILRQYQSFIKDLNTKTSSMRHKASVSQKFPFPGTLTLKGDIVTKEVEIGRERYFITLRDLITDIRNSYYELLYAGHTIHITKDNLELLRQLEQVAYVKYKTGKTGFSDVIKVQTRIAKLEDDLITRQEYEETVIAKINKFLSLEPEFPLGKPQQEDPEDTALSMQSLIDLGIKEKQELKIIRLKIKKTNLAIELAEKKFYPDFTMGFSYFENGKGNVTGAGSNRESFSLKPVSVTKFWFGKNDAYIREARLHYQSLIEKLGSQEDKLKYKVKKVLFQLDTARRDVKLYKDTLLLLARTNLEVSRTDYQAGRSDFLDVLDAQEIWLDYSLLYQKNIMDQNMSMADLERIVGKRLNIFLN